MWLPYHLPGKEILKKKGPGLYALSCTGPGGHECVEEGLTGLFKWRPDLDIDVVQLPRLEGPFPTTDVRDALSNVKEYLTRPPQGITLVAADSLSVCVASRRGVVVMQLSLIHI